MENVCHGRMAPLVGNTGRISRKPVQVTEYAVANNIDVKPAFAWWVPFTIKKKISIIAKSKTQY
jgi:hypothetical protein